jgi:iron complex outermembrane receptor protein
VSSLFVQDEFALSANRIFVTGGVKIEHNAFSGADWQPNIRARWMLPRRQVLWGAVARAVRRPTRFDDDIVATAPNGLELARGSDDFVSEKLTSFEIGYRTMPGPVSVDGTVFAHRYNDLRSQESAPAAPLPIRLGNTLRGRSAGVELGVNIQPLTRWRTHASYTYLDTEITRAANSRDVGQGLSEANDAHHLFSLRTSVDVGPAVELDGFVRYAGALPNPAVPSFTEVNARVSWRLTPRLAVALVGQDLAHARHPEFGPDTPLRLEFERSVRAVVTLRFP